MTSSKIKVVVIGAGKIGSHHARILASLPEAQLVGVCDPNYWRAQMVAWRAGTTAYRDFREVLQRVTAHLQAGTQGVRAGVEQVVPGTAPNATL